MYQDLGRQIEQKCAALQEMRDKEEKSRRDFIPQIDKSIQACAALSQQVGTRVVPPPVTSLPVMTEKKPDLLKLSKWLLVFLWFQPEYVGDHLLQTL